MVKSPKLFIVRSLYSFQRSAVAEVIFSLAIRRKVQIFITVKVIKILAYLISLEFNLSRTIKTIVFDIQSLKDA